MTNSGFSATGVTVGELSQDIQFIQEQFGEAHLYLLYHAAFPIALTPHLLYRLWANFQMDLFGIDWNIPWIAVADLLLSPICREVGHELYEIDWIIREQLLVVLSKHPSLGEKRISELAHFLLAYIQQQPNSHKTSVRNIAWAQRWTSLAYLYPEAAARDLALNLTKLSLDEKTEWVRMASVVETLAAPLKKAQFESLLIYLWGMRDLARGNLKGAESNFRVLPTRDNRIVVAGVTLSIPEFQESVWNLSSLRVPPPRLQRVDFEVAELTLEPKFMNLGSKLCINRYSSEAEIFHERLTKDVVLRMLHIPEGIFQMGAPENEGYYHERPQHLVNIAPFFFSQYPVTQAQWHAIAQTEKVRIELDPTSSEFVGSNLPVEHITWFEAIEFCERLQLQTGRPYRLPSEAEWEYACRAGTETPFNFGEAISPKVAVYDASQKYRSGPRGQSSKQTAEVGSFQIANAFGLYDCHGNVWEWCADHWYEDYTNAPTDGTARLTNKKTSYRVVRGGSWLDVPSICRSAYRNGIPPENRILATGFRIAVSLYKES